MRDGELQDAGEQRLASGRHDVVWIRPVRGLASISAASRTMVSPVIRLSASSTIMKA